MNEFSAIAMFFKEGGSFMWFMLATAIVAVAISAERFIVKPTGEAYSVGHEVETVSLVEFLERRAPRVDASA